MAQEIAELSEILQTVCTSPEAQTREQPWALGRVVYGIRCAFIQFSWADHDNQPNVQLAFHYEPNHDWLEGLVLRNAHRKASVQRQGYGTKAMSMVHEAAILLSHTLSMPASIYFVPRKQPDTEKW
ncbi:hypothetical protein COY28_00035, partial [Candidatus Woesearchaeota archaeon CG_4_10_14_0_2_um_filter_57_5]